MSQSPEPAPVDPEAQTPWAGAQWQPDPDAVPLPVQRVAADPLVPGWGVAEHPSAATATTEEPLPDLAPTPVDGVAPAAPDEAGAAEEPAVADKPAGGPSRPMILVVSAAMLVGSLIFLGVVLSQKFIEDSVGKQVGQLDGAKVATQLAAAGHAMDVYRSANGAYPTDLASLSDYGFRPATSDVSIYLVSTADSDYCLAGAMAGDTPTSWYTGSQGVSKTPCQ